MVFRAYAGSSLMVSCGPCREEYDPFASETGWMGRCIRAQFAEAKGIAFNVVLLTSIFTDLASSRLTSGFALALERAMEAMPKRRSALAMVRALLSLAPQDCKKGSLESCASN